MFLRKDLEYKVDLDGVDIDNEDYIDDDIVGLILWRGTGQESCIQPENLFKSCFGSKWTENASRNCLKVNLSGSEGTC